MSSAPEPGPAPSPGAAVTTTSCQLREQPPRSSVPGWQPATWQDGGNVVPEGLSLSSNRPVVSGLVTCSSISRRISTSRGVNSGNTTASATGGGVRAGARSEHHGEGEPGERLTAEPRLKRCTRLIVAATTSEGNWRRRRTTSDPPVGSPSCGRERRGAAPGRARRVQVLFHL